jgi:hypothetical protein
MDTPTLSNIADRAAAPVAARGISLVNSFITQFGDGGAATKFSAAVTECRLFDLRQTRIECRE